MTRRAAVVGGALAAVAAAGLGLRALATSRTVQLFGTIVARVPTEELAVALSFDDGPTPGRLDSLLGVLEARGVRATFFVTGRELAAAPEAGRKLVAAGHELGNHTYTHPRMLIMGPGRMEAEIERTDSLIRSAGHEGVIFFRPPYGVKLVSLPWWLSRHGRTTVTWDLEPDSYPDVAATPNGIVEFVMSQVEPGSIILLHPWYPSRATSFAAVAPLVDSLLGRGFRVGPVRDLVR